MSGLTRASGQLSVVSCKGGPVGGQLAGQRWGAYLIGPALADWMTRASLFSARQFSRKSDCEPTMNRRLKAASTALLVWTSIFFASAAAQQKPAVDPLDWPYWRGPEYNSISRETGLPDTINPD